MSEEIATTLYHDDVLLTDTYGGQVMTQVPTEGLEGDVLSSTRQENDGRPPSPKLNTAKL